jgi:hypothetical protein
VGPYVKRSMYIPPALLETTSVLMLGGNVIPGALALAEEYGVNL